MKWWVICILFSRIFYSRSLVNSDVHLATTLCDLLKDRGDEFTYTGSGGRDLSGNKRIGEHSFDQTLTHMNR